MYIHFAILLPVAAVAAVVSAAPAELEARDGSCNTGPIQCCQQTQQSNPTTLAYFSSVLGVSLPNLDALLGLGCSPITGVGIGTGSTCTAQTVCCTDNRFQGVINLGCSPINLSL